MSGSVAKIFGNFTRYYTQSWVLRMQFRLQSLLLKSSATFSGIFDKMILYQIFLRRNQFFSGPNTSQQSVQKPYRPLLLFNISLRQSIILSNVSEKVALDFNSQGRNLNCLLSTQDKGRIKFFKSNIECNFRKFQLLNQT